MPCQTAPASLVPSNALTAEQSPLGPKVKVSVYAGRKGSVSGVSSGRLQGEATISLDLKGAESKPAVLHCGWISIGKGKATAAQLILTFRVEPDPCFVFEFDGEPECSP
jgi:hypothetical protein